MMIYVSSVDQEERLQAGRWGNSLAVRLPATAVEGLDLREDGEIEIAGEHRFRIDRDRTRDNAPTRLRALNWTLPPGFRLSRDEANER